MHVELPESVSAALSDVVMSTFGADKFALTPMPGGASTRRYFRLSTARETCVVMWSPEGSKPEEVTATQGRADQERWPFLEVQGLFLKRGVRVPVVIADASEAGLLLLEDLGDQTLAVALERDPSRRLALYTRAVCDLAKMHNAFSDLAPDTVIGRRRFDFTLLRWELQHFLEWGMDARGLELPADDRQELEAAFDQIAQGLADRPLGLVHRDYQSRNLMIDPRDPDGLVVIDFQDAMLGPRSYDLVALLGDSYQNFDSGFVAQMLDLYAESRGMSAAERQDLQVEFDRLTVQRKLKDAGRFVFIERVKKDPSFLPYFEPSMRRVAGALERLQDTQSFATVRHILREVLPS